MDKIIGNDINMKWKIWYFWNSPTSVNTSSKSPGWTGPVDILCSLLVILSSFTPNVKNVKNHECFPLFGLHHTTETSELNEMCLIFVNADLPIVFTFDKWETSHLVLSIFVQKFHSTGAAQSVASYRLLLYSWFNISTYGNKTLEYTLKNDLEFWTHSNSN